MIQIASRSYSQIRRLLMNNNLLERISKDFGLPASELSYIVRSAPARYKVYRIPKKKPDMYRTIAQPSMEVKALQYWYIENILLSLKIHSSATAYTPGSKISNNARKHVRNSYLLKMDFSNFFPSIKPNDFRNYIRGLENPPINEKEVDFSIPLFFWRPKHSISLQLSIGAPSSPILSNIVMYEFDSLVSKLCLDTEVTYTRYADDLTFSTNRKGALFDIHDEIEKIVDELSSPNLSLNSEKTVFSSKKHRRRVTGLILTNDDYISIGREKKRLIRSYVHKFILGELPNKKTKLLKGLVGFVSDVEPEFIEKIKKKYGADIIDRIKGYEVED